MRADSVNELPDDDPVSVHPPSDLKTTSLEDVQSYVPSDADETVGQVLRNTYRILGVLEEGGMGRLYEAEHTRLRRPVAVKVLARHLASDPGALVRFHREAEIVSQLHHPHIVHILDFDTTEAGEPYIVMELLRGETLSRRLDRERQLSIRDAAQIVLQVAAGLSLAHQAGIVHRDLKPDNVFLLAMEDNSIFVKLLDFGISKSASAGAKVTREFDVLGTPDYMAPEQAVSTTRADHRSDQFALAAMTYEIISGRMPFVGESVVDLLHKIVNEDPIPLSRIVAGLPPAIDSVMARALSKAADDRYPTVQDFAGALAFAAGLTASNAPGGWLTTPAPSYPPAYDDDFEGPNIFDQKTLVHRNAGQGSAETSSEVQSGKPEVRLDEPMSDRVAPQNPRLRRHESSPSEPPAPLSIPRQPPTPRFSPLGSTPSGDASTDKSEHRASFRSDPGEPSSQVPRLTPRREGVANSAPGSGRPLDLRRSVAPPLSVNAVRSDSPACPTSNDVENCINAVRQAVTFGERQRATAQARRAMQLARRCRDGSASSVIQDATELLEPLLVDAIGSLSRRISLLRRPAESEGELSPELLYLLSRIDEGTTVEELIDMAPWPRIETLSLVIELSRQGLLQLH